jgi:hypothetical protein
LFAEPVKAVELIDPVPILRTVELAEVLTVELPIYQEYDADILRLESIVRGADADPVPPRRAVSTVRVLAPKNPFT